MANDATSSKFPSNKLPVQTYASVRQFLACKVEINDNFPLDFKLSCDPLPSSPLPELHSGVCEGCVLPVDDDDQHADLTDVLEDDDTGGAGEASDSGPGR